MKKIIEDIKVYSNKSFLKGLVNIFFNANFHSVLIYRLANLFGKMHFVIIPRILSYINRTIYSIDIDYRANLAGGLHLIHGIGTVIGKDVVTLGPVKIYQGVTLGGNSGKKREFEGKIITQPIIFPMAIIYANATVVGPVIINKGAIIGANSLVTKDVEPDTILYSKFENIISSTK